MSKFLRVVYKNEFKDETIINVKNILSVDLHYVGNKRDEDDLILFNLKENIIHSSDKLYEVYSSDVDDLLEFWEYVKKTLGINE